MRRYDSTDDAPAWSIERRVAEQVAADLMGEMGRYWPYRIDPVDWRVSVTDHALWANLELWFELDNIQSMKLSPGLVFTIFDNKQGPYYGQDPLEYFVVSMEIDQVCNDDILGRTPMLGRFLKVKLVFEIARIDQVGEPAYVRQGPCYEDPTRYRSKYQSA